ncbi:HD-GYP domain-containing protein [Bdellovibrio sp. HCB185ZH]|uniref:HD-GYP domain-containing protein n=1 Tax=Bdellovibrio TaxID=958 RepID=UPI001159981B|nr:MULTISPECIES: HD-GYP domain-containing protein [unclassified Bdellovibrio]QDK45911.1 HD family phosphohydrolase [Bdellovibrio sp. ZAP7]QLY24109.1 HD-GYP domain-containing protein [Bdellovibrio sp. KM01]
MTDAQYFRIRLSTIRPDKVTSFDIFLQVDGKYIMYLRAGDKLSDGKIERLHARDTGDSFFVRTEDKQTYRDWVKEEMNSDKLDPFAKAKILRESSVALMEDLFENPDVNKALDESRPIITDFIDLMENAPEAMGFMISLSGHDFYTYNHSLDVSIYSLGLGKAMGYNPKELEELGVGALFHDIGKRNVSLDILCKKGGLTDAEWEQMKMHPQYGLVILNNHPNISDAIKAACFEHHESWSGNGYPQQLMGDEIHPFARIVAITDTYDAMTTQRSYNVPLTPIDAVTMMKEKLAGRYDPDMLKALYSVLFKIKVA